MRATMDDGRQLAGQMLAFDKVRFNFETASDISNLLQHMNLVLADTEEFRRVKQKKKAAAPGATSSEEIEVEDKRTLGLTIVRGTHVISLTVDGPPPADPSSRLGQSAPGGGPASGGAALASGPGTSRPAGRGMPIGLTGPAFGVGGPMAPGMAPMAPGFPGRGGPRMCHPYSLHE